MTNKSLGDSVSRLIEIISLLKMATNMDCLDTSIANAIAQLQNISWNNTETVGGLII